MFVRKVQNEREKHAEQVIKQSMGVRRPPKRTTKERSVEEIHEKPPAKPRAEDINSAEMLESIKITAPGTYELNLPSLFERDELIMAVKDGTYLIDLSSAFRKGKKE
jgi:predicted  nucleic acid-binding Zn-ribbon protein